MNEFEICEKRAAVELVRVARAHVQTYAEPQDRSAALEAVLRFALELAEQKNQA
jgi:hypothetical protein